MTDRTFGVEIECFGPHDAVLEWVLKNNGIKVDNILEDYNDRSTSRNSWVIKEDCSIRGGGDKHELELVSPILKGKKGIKEVKKVCAVLKSLGYETNKSCGLHVHIGANGLTPNNVYSLIKRYNKHEKTIDKLVIPSRRGNSSQYCKSTSKNIEMISKAVGGDTIKQAEINAALEMTKTVFKRKYGEITAYCNEPGERVWNSWLGTYSSTCHSYGCHCSVARKKHLQNLNGDKISLAELNSARNLSKFMNIACQSGNHPERYWKVNTAAYEAHKTIEFRHYHGTVNGTEITDWINFLLNFVQKSVEMTEVSSAQSRRKTTTKPVKVVDHTPFVGLPTTIRRRFSVRSAQL